MLHPEILPRTVQEVMEAGVEDAVGADTRVRHDLVFSKNGKSHKSSGVDRVEQIPLGAMQSQIFAWRIQRCRW